MEFSGHPISLSLHPDGNDVIIKAFVVIDRRPKYYSGLLSQLIAFKDSGYRYGYFGDIPITITGSNIHIGCLQESVSTFNSLILQIKSQQSTLTTTV